MNIARPKTIIPAKTRSPPEQDANRLAVVNYAATSIKASITSSRTSSHGSEPGKPHSRARLRDLARKWLRARRSRSALVCCRAGSLGDTNGRARRQTGPEKETTVACTFECRQNARAGQLRPHEHGLASPAAHFALGVPSGPLRTRRVARPAALRCDFGVQSAREFNGFQLNSLRNRIGNFQPRIRE